MTELIYAYSLPIALAIAAIFFTVAVFVVLWAINLRQVVEPNVIHAVTARRTVTYYGTDEAGRSYYKWPEWMPIIGVQVKELPTDVFAINLNNHKAWDKDNVPFKLAVTALFKLDLNKLPEAFRSIQSMERLKDQLGEIIESVVRETLATFDILVILRDRQALSQKFKEAIENSAGELGITAVRDVAIKQIEDADGSNAIEAIRAQKQATHDRESRVRVAEENKTAQEAEINAALAITLAQEQQREEAGKREASASLAVQLAKETTNQQTEEARLLTTQKSLAVVRYQDTEKANIELEVAKTEAEAKAKEVEIAAAAALVQEQRKAEGVEAAGRAAAAAEQEMQMATVHAQIQLAKELAENVAYQQYLLDKYRVDAAEKVGLENAKALAKANLQFFVTGPNTSEGLNAAASKFSPEAGLNLGSALEGLMATPVGKKVVNLVDQVSSNPSANNASKDL